MSISEFELEKRIELMKDLIRLYISFFADSPLDLEIMKTRLAEFLLEDREDICSGNVGFTPPKV